MMTVRAAAQIPISILKVLAIRLLRRVAATPTGVVGVVLHVVEVPILSHLQGEADRHQEVAGPQVVVIPVVHVNFEQ